MVTGLTQCSKISDYVTLSNLNVDLIVNKEFQIDDDDEEVEVIEVEPEDNDERDGADLPDGACPICEREMPLTKHHLVPRETHAWYSKRGWTKEQLHSGVGLCRDCHSAIHRFISNRDLAKEYYSLALLLQHPKVQKWIPYAQKQRTTNKADRRYSTMNFTHLMTG